MRASQYVSACIACLLYSAICCSAQKLPADCVGPLIQQTLPCDGPHDCHSQVDVDYGGEGDYVEYVVKTKSCCGQLFTTIFPTGDCDGGGLLKDPGTKDQIYRAAKESAILVADCRGHYVPYNSGASGPDGWAPPPSRWREQR
jgi:hypothetical protein